MKICFHFNYHPNYSIGGAEIQMILIAKQLQEKGVDHRYVTRKYKKDQKKYEIAKGIKIHNIGNQCIKSPHTLREKIFNLINSYDLIFFYLFRKFDFDIYHLRSTSLNGFCSNFIKIFKRKKFVFTIPTILIFMPNSLQWSKLKYKFFKFNIKRADIVIVLAEYMKKALYENLGIKSVVIKSGHPIPNGPFKKDDPPTILWISHLIKPKRPELFLKIARELKDLRATFLLIGPDEYMKQKIIDFSNRQKNFTFIPGVPAGKDNYYYEKASLLINTSIYAGFPNTFIQAWLRETPVISLNVDPDCDICKNGLGYHAKGNINELTNKIKELIENPSKLKEMGENCRKYAIKNHDIKKKAQQHYKLYKWLLKKK